MLLKDVNEEYNSNNSIDDVSWCRQAHRSHEFISVGSKQSITVKDLSATKLFIKAETYSYKK